MEGSGKVAPMATCCFGKSSVTVTAPWLSLGWSSQRILKLNLWDVSRSITIKGLTLRRELAATRLPGPLP